MSIFMPDRFLAGSAKDDVLSQADSISGEALCDMEGDSIKRMLPLSLQEEEKKQSDDVLWQLPQI